MQIEDIFCTTSARTNLAPLLLKMSMLPYSFIGSCRYEHVFQNVYPGRLHSVREINYFLENLDNLKNYFNYHISSNPIFKTFVNLTFGNVFNTYLKNKTFIFPYQLQSFLESEFLFLEISNLKYASSMCGIIGNSSFLKNKNKESKTDYTSEEIFNDNFFVLKKDDFSSVTKQIEKMIDLLKVRTPLRKIFLIPHVNLLSKKTNKKIENRQEINLIIDNLANNFGIIEKIDIWESEKIKNYYLEDILNDNNLNFNKLGNKIVYDFFISEFKKIEENKTLFCVKHNHKEKFDIKIDKI